MMHFSEFLNEDNLLLLFLLYPSAADLKKRSFLPAPVLLSFCAVLAARVFLISEPEFSILSAAAGSVPGLVFFALSRITGGAIGSGDALILLLAGILTGWRQVLLLCTAAFFLAVIPALILLLRRRGNKKTELPFLPFLLAGEFLLLAAEKGGIL